MKTVIVTNAKNIVNTDIDNDNNNHYNVIKILLFVCNGFEHYPCKNIMYTNYAYANERSEQANVYIFTAWKVMILTWLSC